MQSHKIWNNDLSWTGHKYAPPPLPPQGGMAPTVQIFCHVKYQYSNCLAEFYNIYQVDWQQTGITSHTYLSGGVGGFCRLLTTLPVFKLWRKLTVNWPQGDDWVRQPLYISCCLATCTTSCHSNRNMLDAGRNKHGQQICNKTHGPTVTNTTRRLTTDRIIQTTDLQQKHTALQQPTLLDV